MSSTKSGKIVSSSSSDGLDEADLYQSDSSLQWDKETEETYLERVRERASESAKEIILQARTEAEEIKQNAYQEGLAAGQKEIEEQSARVKQDFQDKFNSFLDQLQKEKEKHWNAHKAEIVQLINLAVEKIVKKEIQENRLEIISALLEESLQLLDNRRGVSVYVNNEDLDLLQEAIEQARNKFANLENWQVEESSNIAPGGILLENSESKVENSVTQRWESVLDILNRIFDEESK